MQACGHCGRTSHGFACCGTLGCNRDHHSTGDPDDQNRPYGAPRSPEGTGRAQHGPTPPRRPVRRIDPKGTR